jgi:hypothetical protein
VLHYILELGNFFRKVHKKLLHRNSGWQTANVQMLYTEIELCTRKKQIFEVTNAPSGLRLESSGSFIVISWHAKESASPDSTPFLHGANDHWGLGDLEATQRTHL